MAGKLTMKKGGSARFVIENFADNDTFVVPEGFKIEGVYVKKSGTTAGNISIGTTDGGIDVVNTVALSASDKNVAALTLLLSHWSTEKKLYVTVSSAASGTLTVLLQKLF